MKQTCHRTRSRWNDYSYATIYNIDIRMSDAIPWILSIRSRHNNFYLLREIILEWVNRHSNQLSVRIGIITDELSLATFLTDSLFVKFTYRAIHVVMQCWPSKCHGQTLPHSDLEFPTHCLLFPIFCEHQHDVYRFLPFHRSVRHLCLSRENT